MVKIITKQNSDNPEFHAPKFDDTLDETFDATGVYLDPYSEAEPEPEVLPVSNELKPEMKVKKELDPEKKPVLTVDIGVIDQLREFREIFDSADKDEDGLLNDFELGMTHRL